jgi:hypothetical protein
MARDVGKWSATITAKSKAGNNEALLPVSGWCYQTSSPTMLSDACQNLAHWLCRHWAYRQMDNAKLMNQEPNTLEIMFELNGFLTREADDEQV